jgi:hypothetical protein
MQDLQQTLNYEKLTPSYSIVLATTPFIGVKAVNTKPQINTLHTSAKEGYLIYLKHSQCRI